MSRINTNVSSLVAQRVLTGNNHNLNTALERLSTGLRISRGKDDPAGLIASENLRAEKTSINAAISNAERADQVVNIAEGGLQEVSSLLTELQGLLTASASKAGLSDSEREANQLQIDSILQTIDRIASATSFQGTRLLNGNFDYEIDGVAAGVADFRVNGAKFDGDSLEVSAVVTQSAQQGGLYLSLNAAAGLDLQGNSANESAFTIEIGGALGARELQFSSGQTLTQMAAAINSFKSVTGVEATVSGGGLSLKSTEFGSSEFVSVRVVNDAGIGTNDNIGVYNYESDDANTVNTTITATFDAGTAKNGIRDAGRDLAGTINGIQATGSGKTLRINTDFLDTRITLDETNATQVGNISAFTIKGGGADFQLGGQVDIGNRVSIGIGDVASRKLGNSELGFLSELASGKKHDVISSDNLGDAQKIVGASIEQVSSLRGRLGAFQRNTVGATIRSLGVSLENTAAAESVIRDADFAAETASLTRNQILVSASTNVLAMANSQPQAVLQLLG